jgi:hypothetical protein
VELIVNFVKEKYELSKKEKAHEDKGQERKDQREKVQQIQPVPSTGSSFMSISSVQANITYNDSLSLLIVNEDPQLLAIEKESHERKAKESEQKRQDISETVASQAVIKCKKVFEMASSTIKGESDFISNLARKLRKNPDLLEASMNSTDTKDDLIEGLATSIQTRQILFKKKVGGTLCCGGSTILELSGRAHEGTVLDAVIKDAQYTAQIGANMSTANNVANDNNNTFASTELTRRIVNPATIHVKHK